MAEVEHLEALLRQGRREEALAAARQHLATAAAAEKAALCYFLGACLLAQQDEAAWAEGEAYLEQAKALYLQLGQTEQAALALAEQARRALHSGSAAALQAALKTLDLAQALQGEATGKAAARIAHYRAVSYDQLGDKARAFEYFMRAYELAQDEAEAARILDDLGLYYASIGKRRLARSCLRQAMAKKVAVGDQQGQARTAGRLGRLLLEAGDMAAAVTALEQALELAEAVDDAYELAWDYCSLARAYMGMQAYARAAACLERGLALATRHGFATHIAAAHIGRAELLLCQGDATAALAVLRQHAIPELRARQQPRELAAAYHLEGRILARLGQHHEAVSALREAILLYHQHLCPCEQATVTLTLARLYIAMRCPEEAKAAVRAVVEMAETLGHTQLVREADELLEQLDPKEAVQRAFRRLTGQEAGGQTFLLGGQREELTVLASDIVGFTAYAMLQDLQAVTQTLNDYFALMTEVIRRHHGYVDKYAGDGLLAIFRPLPGAAHHAHRAVQAAMAMLDRLHDLNRERAILGQEALRIRIGISSGEAILGNIGCYGKMDYTAVGPPVILASRLEEYAAANTICISEETHALLGGHFHVVPLPSFTPKGFPTPQRVWQVLGNRPLLKYPVAFMPRDAAASLPPGAIALKVPLPALEGAPVLTFAAREATASVAAQVYANPDRIRHYAESAGKQVHLLMPQQPDFDTVVAAYLVQEILEAGTLPRGAKALVDYAGHVLADTLPPPAAWWNTPYGVVLGIWGRNARYCAEHGLGPEQQDLYSLQRLFYFLQYLLGRLVAGVDLLRPEANPPLFADGFPFRPPFERERAFVKRDYEAYQHDLTYATVFNLPPATGPSATAVAVEAPTSTLFAFWAHHDTGRTESGFALVLVYTAGHCCLTVRLPLRPRLAALCQALAQAEQSRWCQAGLEPPAGPLWQIQAQPGVASLEPAAGSTRLSREELIAVLRDPASWEA